MSFCKLYSAQIHFLTGRIVDVEVDLSTGLYAFSIIGLADKAVDEARDRIGAAIKNTGFTSPKQKNQKVVISLAPADIKKEGPSFDLSMAMGYLLASKQIQFDPKEMLFLGELSLDGEVRAIKGVLPLIIEARRQSFKHIFVPKENASEAALIEGVEIYGANTLQEVVCHINTLQKVLIKKIIPQSKTILKRAHKTYTIDFQHIQGNQSAKRALEIAASGKHNIILYGPPGTGKTMLCEAFQYLLPDLSYQQQVETISIHSLYDKNQKMLTSSIPFRAPHHTASYSSIIGGGSYPRPGEITLAHCGVLYLDEFPEFSSQVIDSLREPLQSKKIYISRSKQGVVFAADFILLGSMNPCPCGFRGSKKKQCSCLPTDIHRYRKKLSGPIMDRIDLWVEVHEVSYSKLSSKENYNESSAKIAERVAMARRIQLDRGVLNADITPENLLSMIDIDISARKLLELSAEKLNLSGRVFHKILKISQTIADLEGSKQIKTPHVLEALQYRPNFIQSDDKN